MNNSDLGLNEFLQPNNSPIHTNKGATSGYQFDYLNERSSISAAKIQNFSFNQGIGGTLTLGGVGNGNGILSVQNSGGTEIVSINNGGIVVSGGSIVIKNVDGGTVLDSEGLVSLNSFTQNVASTVSSSFQTINYGSAEANVTGGSINIVASRPSVVMLMADVSMIYDIVPGTASYPDSVVYTAETSVRMKLGTATVETILVSGVVSPVNGTDYVFSLGASNNTFSGHHIGTVPAGTTTYKLTAEITSLSRPTGGGTPKVYLNTFKISSVILGT